MDTYIQIVKEKASFKFFSKPKQEIAYSVRQAAEKIVATAIDERIRAYVTLTLLEICCNYV